MNIQPVNAITLKKAAGLLRAGKLVVFPTETVYGLGADATNDLAVAEIFSIKGRPEFNPLIVHVSDVAMAKQFVAWNETAEKLANLFCPGPLTIILQKLPGSKISLLASAGGDTIGIRFPANEDAQALLREAGIPVAAPSANRSGRVSPTTAQHVYEELGDSVPLILNGGACEVGIESSVIDASGDDVVLFRPGFITLTQMESALGEKISIFPPLTPPASGREIPGIPPPLAGEVRWGTVNDGKLKSPGQLASHYAPSLPVRLNVIKPEENEALLAFGSRVPTGAKFTLNLSIKGDLKEAAARLFASLRELDKPDSYSAIGVMPIPDEDIGAAVNDRLRRAAVK